MDEVERLAALGYVRRNSFGTLDLTARGIDLVRTVRSPGLPLPLTVAIVEEA